MKRSYGLMLNGLLLLGCARMQAEESTAPDAEAIKAEDVVLHSAVDAEPLHEESAKAEPVAEQHEAPMPIKKKEAPVEAAKDQALTPVQEAEEASFAGIDTLDQEGGNWLLKRQALEKTVDLIEQINAVFTKILEGRMDFLVRRNRADREFDTFANTMGFELGDLSNHLNALVDKLEQDRRRAGSINESERALEEKLEKKINGLHQLQADVKAITDLDASMDDVIMQVEQEISKSHAYQAQAWNNFQQIKKVLSDEKAEELHLQTDGLLKNMHDIQAYLKGQLLDYFNKTVATLKQNMSKAGASLKALETDGFNLAQELKKLEAAATDHEQAVKKEIKAPAAKSSGSWLGLISWLWEYPIAAVKGVTSWVGSFFGSEKPVEKVAIEPTETAIEPVASQEQSEDLEKKP